jgi:hypothetical protein
MDETPLTPLQQSARDTGRRFFSAPEPIYTALCLQIDERRGFPAGEGTAAVTERGLPLPENCLVTDTGDILISSETWRILPADEEMLVAAIASNMINEHTLAEYEALSPAPAPFPA